MEGLTLEPKAYICNNCDEQLVTPQHCGRPMRIEIVKETKVWICWKGDHTPCCGRDAIEDYEACCDNPELTGTLKLEKENILL